MVTKEELEAEVNTWKGVNKYLYEEARDKLEKGEYDKPSNVKKTESYYKNKTVVELKSIAKKRGIPKYYDLREDELIKKIMAGD